MENTSTDAFDLIQVALPSPSFFQAAQFKPDCKMADPKQSISSSVEEPKRAPAKRSAVLKAVLCGPFEYPQFKMTEEETSKTAEGGSNLLQPLSSFKLVTNSCMYLEFGERDLFIYLFWFSQKFQVHLGCQNIPKR